MLFLGTHQRPCGEVAARRTVFCVLRLPVAFAGSVADAAGARCVSHSLQGGAIFAVIEVEAVTSSFRHCVVIAGNGGAVYSEDGGAILTGCDLTNVSAMLDGGAVWAGTTASVVGSQFTDTQSLTGSGGAIWAGTAVSTVSSSFSVSVARVSGGALYGLSVTVQDSSFVSTLAAQVRNDSKENHARRWNDGQPQVVSFRAEASLVVFSGRRGCFRNFHFKRPPHAIRK